MSYFIVAVIAFGLGYLVCSVATWNRVHQHEGKLRGLVNAIDVSRTLGEEVPPEWLQHELESIVAEDFR